MEPFVCAAQVAHNAIRLLREGRACTEEDLRARVADRTVFEWLKFSNPGVVDFSLLRGEDRERVLDGVAAMLDVYVCDNGGNGLLLLLEAALEMMQMAHSGNEWAR